MCPPTNSGRIGLLLSGGLDSCILLGELLRRKHQVLPIYVQSGLIWEEAELRSLRRFLVALGSDCVEALDVLQVPVDDVYQGHWSLTGSGVPNADSPDDAVHLPARNALLSVKAALCCFRHGVENLAIGILGTSPFTDASADFFAQLARAINTSLNADFQIHRPFAEATKQDVMEMGRDLPLEWTFSCLSPQQQLHCGQCNKCAERRLAFREVGLEDPTQYAATSSTTS